MRPNWETVPLNKQPQTEHIISHINTETETRAHSYKNKHKKKPGWIATQEAITML